ncbi:hypothetical protein ABU614_06595 [Lysobacter firmicutimachus]|uniref:Lipoprotein n=1 Tax=Lysobacter firmicutimachus TaxID=1792846 RepID=A0AAU8MV23_9GAMM
MKTPLPLTLAGCFLFALTACSNAVLDPKYERNPNPRQKRVVTATIDGAPGSFAEATASVQYIIGPERTCMPSAEPFSGTFPTPERFPVTLPVRRLSDNRFEFDYYQDGMLPKDYFGKGLCNWQVETVNLYLKSSNDPNQIGYSVSLFGGDIGRQQRTVFYAQRKLFAATTTIAGGIIDPAQRREDFERLYGSDPSKSFTITIEAKE